MHMASSLSCFCWEHCAHGFIAALFLLALSRMPQGLQSLLRRTSPAFPFLSNTLAVSVGQAWS